MNAKASDSNLNVNPRRTLLTRLAFKSVRVALLAYVGLIVCMLFLENQLVYPGTQIKGSNWNPRGIEFEEVVLRSADGTKIHGWYLQHADPRGYLMYCHGNGTNVAELAGHLDRLREQHQLSVFAFDYRGFGKSEGSPHETGVIADSEAAHQWLVQRESISPEDIILFGRSLGGAVAVHLASKYGAKGVVLERTFTSLPDVASATYWWLPVKLFMQNRYPSLQQIKKYHGKLLQSHGDCDHTIQYELGRRLFDACPSKHKEFVCLNNIGHNDRNPSDYQQMLGRFLQDLTTQEDQ